MVGEQDDSGRFDYLFEPLDNDVANAEDIVAPAVEQADADDRRSRTAATRIGIAAVVVPQPQLRPQPQPAPTPSASATSASATKRMPPSPTVRPPISVEPEPHPSFPNQNLPGDNDQDGGGLLPGLGGLPGPL